MPPSVETNTKYECEGCGAIADLGSADNMLGNMHACDVCGSREWRQLRIVRACDFCGTTQNVSWEFECGRFTIAFIPGGTQTYDDPWAACDVCKKFVENGEREALVARAMKTMPSRRYPARVALTRMVHNGFFDNRTGDAVPFHEED